MNKNKDHCKLAVPLDLRQTLLLAAVAQSVLPRVPQYQPQYMVSPLGYHTTKRRVISINIKRKAPNNNDL